MLLSDGRSDNKSNNMRPEENGNIPASFWESQGHDVFYIAEVNAFIKQLKDVTDQLTNEEYAGVKSLVLGNWDWGISFDDIFYPYWQQFARALNSYHQGIDTLSIIGIQFLKPVHKILIPSLKNKNLTALTFEDNNFGADGIIFVSELLKENSCLKSLRLENNVIDDVNAATQLSQSIINNPSLVAITLWRCGLGDSETMIQSTILGACIGINDVSLYGNQIGLQGCTVISLLLEENNDIEALDLRNNKVNDETASRLALALRSNKILRNLNLTSNDISETGKESLRNAIFGKSSMNEVADSNHTCVVIVDRVQHDLFDDSDSLDSDEEIDVLTMNHGSPAYQNKKNKICIALNGEDNIKQNLRHFNDFRLELMPRIFELLQEDPNQSRCLSNIFDIVCSKVPLLFVSNEISGNKRKRPMTKSGKIVL